MSLTHKGKEIQRTPSQSDLKDLLTFLKKNGEPQNITIICDSDLTIKSDSGQNSQFFLCLVVFLAALQPYTFKVVVSKWCRFRIFSCDGRVHVLLAAGLRLRDDTSHNHLYPSCGQRCLYDHLSSTATPAHPHPPANSFWRTSIFDPVLNTFATCTIFNTSFIPQRSPAHSCSYP